MDGIQLSQGYRATVSPQDCLVKVDSTLELLSGFESRTPGLGIQDLNH